MLDIPEKSPTQAKIKKVEREKNIIELRNKKYTYDEIAKTLGIGSTKTVQRALKKIEGKQVAIT